MADDILTNTDQIEVEAASIQVPSDLDLSDFDDSPERIDPAQATADSDPGMIDTQYEQGPEEPARRRWRRSGGLDPLSAQEIVEPPSPEDGDFATPTDTIPDEPPQEESLGQEIQQDLSEEEPMTISPQDPLGQDAEYLREPPE